MEIHLTPSQEMQLNELAVATGRDPDELVQEAIEKMLAYNSWFKEQVQLGLDQLDRGEFIEHEEVGKRLEKLFQP